MPRPNGNSGRSFPVLEPSVTPGSLIRLGQQVRAAKARGKPRQARAHHSRLLHRALDQTGSPRSCSPYDATAGAEYHGGCDGSDSRRISARAVASSPVLWRDHFPRPSTSYRASLELYLVDYTFSWPRVVTDLIISPPRFLRPEFSLFSSPTSIMLRPTSARLFASTSRTLAGTTSAVESRAIVFTEHGDPTKVLQSKRYTLPELEKGQVRLRFELGAISECILPPASPRAADELIENLSTSDPADIVRLCYSSLLAVRACADTLERYRMSSKACTLRNRKCGKTSAASASWATRELLPSKDSSKTVP